MKPMNSRTGCSEGSSKRVLIDTDPGIDDCLAILYGLRSRNLAIRAITTTFGNADVSRTTKNLLGILQLAGCGRLPRIGMGRGEPLNPRRRQRAVSGSHGSNALGNAVLPKASYRADLHDAVELIVNSIDKGKIDTIITLGPLTNVARALRDAVRIKRLRNIFVMAGTLRCKGSVAGWAETNAYHDPEALDAVLHSGIPITLISLDTTKDVLLREEDVAFLEGRHDVFSVAILKMIRYAIRYNQKHRGNSAMLLHDPVCVAIAEDESLGRYERACVTVDSVVKRGRICLGKKRMSSVRMCVSIDVEAFRKRFIKRLKGYI